MVLVAVEWAPGMVAGLDSKAAAVVVGKPVAEGRPAVAGLGSLDIGALVHWVARRIRVVASP